MKKDNTRNYGREKEKKRLRPIAAAFMILTILAVFIISPYSRYALSLSVMSAYSKICEQDSILEEKGMKLDIPGGRDAKDPDWYPFVMTFNPSRHSVENYLGEKGVRLTILYNFPAFDLRWGKGCSRLYDDTSPYYNGFYGAYILSGESRLQREYNREYNKEKTVLSDLEADTAEKSKKESEYESLSELIGKITQFDYQRLVIGDFPIEPDQEIFQWKIRQIQKKTSVAGMDGWIRIDADMLVNGSLHHPQNYVRSYLQYGSPKYDAETDFAPVEMKGRVYARYFKEQDAAVFFYVMARTEKVLETCDRKMLQTAVLQ